MMYFSFHKDRFHDRFAAIAPVHTVIPVCVCVCGSDSAPSLAAFSCLKKKNTNLCPSSNNTNRLIVFCSCFTVARSKLDS